jgi:hypothetical protein
VRCAGLVLQADQPHWFAWCLNDQRSPRDMGLWCGARWGRGNELQPGRGQSHRPAVAPHIGGSIRPARDHPWFWPAQALPMARGRVGGHGCGQRDTDVGIGQGASRTSAREVGRTFSRTLDAVIDVVFFRACPFCGPGQGSQGSHSHRGTDQGLHGLIVTHRAATGIPTAQPQSVDCWAAGCKKEV